MNSKNKRIKFERKLWVKLFDEFQQSLKSMRCVTWDERKKKISIGWRHPFILRVCESRSELSLFSSLCDKLKINRDQLFLKMMEKSWVVGVSLLFKNTHQLISDNIFVSFIFWVSPWLFVFLKLIRLKWRFTNKVSFKRARTVVPLQSLAVTIPQLQTMFLLSVLVSEIVLFQKQEKLEDKQKRENGHSFSSSDNWKV
jgi:hypothetical protein